MGPIIGRGSFGCCYKATDKLTGQQVRSAKPNPACSMHV
jgi:hypothetical protein